MSLVSIRFFAIVLTGVFLSVDVAAEQVQIQTTITFLNKKQAEKAIINDKLEPYFSKLQPMEMGAKTGFVISGSTLNKQREECRKRYQAAVLEFTPEEKAAIKWHVDKVKPFLIKKYPFFGKMPWNFLKISDTIEGGLPHTRDNCIVLSESMCEQIREISKVPPEQMAFLSIVDLLVHEQMHVFQRKYNKKFDSLYKKVWGFEKAESIKGCEWLVKHHLANPDAVECPWVLPVSDDSGKSYLWPLVVFSKGDGLKQMPGDFRMLAINIRKTEDGFEVVVDEEGIPVSNNLLSVPAFRKIFPMSQNIYHPHEASADMFAKLVLFDNLLPKERLNQQVKDRMEKALRPLRVWFEENLK